jgi:hypothetical protein
MAPRGRGVGSATNFSWAMEPGHAHGHPQAGPVPGYFLGGRTIRFSVVGRSLLRVSDEPPIFGSVLGSGIDPSEREQ